MNEGEHGCLRLLLAYFKFYPNDLHLFRAIVSNWYAHKRGDCFLNKNGKPKWFNRPNPCDPRLPKMDFISEKAFKTIYGKTNDRLIIDHAVPLKVLHGLILKARPDEVSLEGYLLRYHTLGVLTKEEDIRLSSKGWKHKMPEEWDGLNPFARYDGVPIFGKRLKGFH